MHQLPGNHNLVPPPRLKRARPRRRLASAARSDGREQPRQGEKTANARGLRNKLLQEAMTEIHVGIYPVSASEVKLNRILFTSACGRFGVNLRGHVIQHPHQGPAEQRTSTRTAGGE